MYPKVIGILEQSVRAAGLRHQVIANNIANVNVPGFQASEVAFEDQLRDALHGSQVQSGLQGLTADPRHIPIHPPSQAPVRVDPRIQVAATGIMRQDGNTVDVEAETAKLAVNQLWYQALVQSVQDEFTRLRTAINEGRR
ncbi:MAG TPA: flagellar basal body rod protein FlgB [Symbiobacteriaceae bacterium]|nr:flagellar basal body rod protein FlgB [Symbiobacteriaceae bacterium]